MSTSKEYPAGKPVLIGSKQRDEEAVALMFSYNSNGVVIQDPEDKKMMFIPYSNITYVKEK